jgi:hypothetical protein
MANPQHHPADAGPKTSRLDRQLTIGECLAITRYGSNELDERPMTARQVLDLIDRLEVCTTCGWSLHLHATAVHGFAPQGICDHYTREV